MLVIECVLGHKLHPTGDVLYRAKQCTFSLTKILGDERLKDVRSISCVSAPEDRQVAEDVANHHPGVAVPGRIYNLALIASTGDIASALESVGSFNQ